MSTRLTLWSVLLLMATACRGGDEAPAPKPPAEPPATAEAPLAPDPDDPWALTGLTFDQAAEAMTPEGCYESEQRFLACVHGLSEALSAVDERLALVPLAHAHAEVPAARVLRREGRLAVVERGAAVDQPDAQARAEALRAEIAAWRAVHAATATERVDWAGLVAWFRDARVTTANEAATTAAAINGFLATAKDPFHRIVPTERDDALRERAGTTHVGVGAYVQVHDGQAVISGLVAEGPAARAGVRVGDVLEAIDGAATAGLSADEVVARLRGEAGSEVAMGLRREGAALALRVTRAKVATRYVQEATLHVGERRLGFVYVPTFYSTHICAQLREGLARLEAQDVAAWVLDLRGNVGGLTDEALCVADLFLPAGRLVARLLRDSGEPVEYRTEAEAATSLPLVVVVDASTGSAAEILAGALQDEGRARVVGQRTYGKGTVQNPFPWGEGVEATVYFTSGRYHLPSGRALHLAGVVPDVVVEAVGAEGGAARAPARVELEYLEALLLPEEQASAAGVDVAALTQARGEAAGALRACVGSRVAAAEGWYGVGPAGREPLGRALAAAAAAAECALSDSPAAP